MSNTNKIVGYEPGKFCGVISHSVSSLEKGTLNNLISESLDKCGCIIYVYNSPEDFEQKENIFKSWNVNYDELIKNKSIMYISSKDNYFEEGIFCTEKIMSFYENLIDRCKSRGCKKIIIIGRRDDFYDKNVSLEKMIEFHKDIRALCRNKQIMVFTTYIMDIFTEDSFFSLMPLHDMFILDDEDQSYLYFTENLQKLKSLIKFLRNIFIDKVELYKDKNKLEFLNKLIMKISYKESEGELLNEALKTISTIVGADFGYMLNYNDEEQRDIAAQYNLPYGFLDELSKLEYNVYSKIRYSPKKIRINHSSRYKNPTRVKMIKEHNIESIIEIPIKEENKEAMSAIFLFFTNKNEFSTKHTPFLKAVSNTLLALLKKRKESEEQKKELIKTEKLKNLGELSGGIAHDFNNVLTAILGFSRVALDKVENEEIREYIDIIHKSALDGKSIVDKIQVFTRKKANKIKEPIIFNTIVESSVQMAKPKWKNFYESIGVGFELIRELKTESYINCNEHEIREAILNIILNAMDAMENGGKLIIKTYDTENRVILEIEDTGIGMSQQVKEQIFEPFYSTKESRGTGLGLSITKEIIEEHSGRIRVESEVGKGTKFILDFEKFYVEDVVKEEKDIIPTFGEIKSLIVDDKVQVARSIKELLGILEVRCDIETSSEKVEDKLFNNKYDVIFCDLAMPKLSGLDLAKKIKVKYPDTHFILMTGWPETIEGEYIDKIDYILGKPCMVEDLVKALDKVKNNEKYNNVE